MNFFFSATFDFTLGGIILVLAIVFFMGKGSKLLTLFEGASNNYTNMKKKQTPEENLHYQRTMGVFLLVLAGLEFFMGFFGTKFFWANWVAVGGVIADFVWLVLYLRKHFPQR